MVIESMVPKNLKIAILNKGKRNVTMKISRMKVRCDEGCIGARALGNVRARMINRYVAMSKG
jgi:hypothetical protein